MVPRYQQGQILCALPLPLPPHKLPQAVGVVGAVAVRLAMTVEQFQALDLGCAVVLLISDAIKIGLRVLL